jgi:hypothetical protein
MIDNLDMMDDDQTIVVMTSKQGDSSSIESSHFSKVIANEQDEEGRSVSPNDEEDRKVV